MGDYRNLHESPDFNKYHETLDYFQEVLFQEKEL